MYTPKNKQGSILMSISCWRLTEPLVLGVLNGGQVEVTAGKPAFKAFSRTSGTTKLVKNGISWVSSCCETASEVQKPLRFQESHQKI